MNSSRLADISLLAHLKDVVSDVNRVWGYDYIPYISPTNGRITLVSSSGNHRSFRDIVSAIAHLDGMMRFDEEHPGVKDTIFKYFRF